MAQKRWRPALGLGLVILGGALFVSTLAWVISDPATGFPPLSYPATALFLTAIVLIATGGYFLPRR
ncbi:MAG: hypothetical protein WAN74_07810 [Thermoplasmata archaeon]